MFYIMGEAHSQQNTNDTGNMADIIDRIPANSEIWVEWNNRSEMSLLSRALTLQNEGKPPSPLVALAEAALLPTTRSSALLQRFVYIDIRRQGVFQILDAIVNYRTFIEYGARDFSPDVNILGFIMPTERAFFANLATRKAALKFLRSMMDPEEEYQGWFKDQIDRFVAQGLTSATHNPLKEALSMLAPDTRQSLLRFAERYWKSALDSHRTASQHLVIERYDKNRFFTRLFAILMDVYVSAKVLASVPSDNLRVIMMGENHAHMVGNILANFTDKRFTFEACPSGIDFQQIRSYQWNATMGDPRYMLKAFRNLRAKKYKRAPPYQDV